MCHQHDARKDAGIEKQTKCHCGSNCHIMMIIWSSLTMGEEGQMSEGKPQAAIYYHSISTMY